VSDIEARTKKRIQRTGEQVFDAGLVILFFEAVPFFDAPGADAEPDTKRRSGQGRGRSASTAG
jgi:hypothetical protein